MATRSQLRRSLILQKVPRFLTRRELWGIFQRYGQVEEVELIHRPDHTYTNCCLLVMTNVADANVVLRNGPIMMRKMKVVPSRYSLELLADVVIKGQYEVPVDVPFEEGDEPEEGHRFYEDLQVIFQHCNITDIKLFKEGGLYWGGANVFVKTLDDRHKAIRTASYLEDGLIRISRR